jgi:hypothetical protein
MVDGEFSPNVGKSPNHSINSFSIADAGGFNCTYASAERAAEAESSGVRVDVEALLMSVEFLHGCHDDRFKFPPES